MSTGSDLRDGTAQALHAAGVGTYRSGPADPYQSGDTAPILFNRMPPSPDVVLVLTTYARPAAHQHGLQVRCRGADEDDVDADDLADAVRGALHGLHDLTWGGTDLALLTFASAARLGSDDTGRDEVAVNFIAVTSDPSTSLVDLD